MIVLSDLEQIFLPITANRANTILHGPRLLNIGIAKAPPVQLYMITLCNTVSLTIL